MTTLTTQHAHGAGFLAAEYLHTTSTAKISPVALYSHFHFGVKPKDRRAALDRAITTGWLSRTADGFLQLGAPAIAYFNPGDAETPAPLGNVATSRMSSAYDRPPLRYFTNSKGNRHDIPDFSVRSGVSFKTVAGGSA